LQRKAPYETMPLPDPDPPFVAELEASATSVRPFFEILVPNALIFVVPLMVMPYSLLEGHGRESTDGVHSSCEYCFVLFFWREGGGGSPPKSRFSHFASSTSRAQAPPDGMQNIIWAFSNTAPESKDANVEIKVHHEFGGGTLNLTRTAAAPSAGDDDTDESGDGGDGANGSGSIVSWLAGFVHAGLCMVAFLLVIPSGALVVRYAKLTGSPARVLKAVRGLLDFLYLAQLPSQTTDTISRLERSLVAFHENKEVFIDLGVRDHFNVPKIHSLLHYSSSIVLFGTTDNYNTEHTERLHIDFTKDAYRATNHKDEYNQMTTWLERREKLQQHATSIKWRQQQHLPATTLPQRPLGTPPQPGTQYLKMT
jgi:hypothetical protein